MKTQTRRDQLHAQQLVQAQRQRSRKRLHRIAGWGSSVLAVVVVAVMLLTSGVTTATDSEQASAFSLTSTADAKVSLADFRGRNVLLYFSEGAGCGACLVQMTEIERNQQAFDAANLTVLPIVMNTKAQITADMTRYGTKTPFLLDDGTVSKAYGTLGKGMHAGLPGHSFVLIDANGVQRWYGEYPSMWLAPADLLKEVKQHLSA